MTVVEVGIINYPKVMQSSLYGLEELFLLANQVGEQHEVQAHFSVALHDLASIEQSLTETDSEKAGSSLQIVIIPPSVNGDYYLSPEQRLKDWILKQHASGAVMCSACAGTFVLAETGLLNNRPATTHWGLASVFANQYPAVKLDINKILINEGDIITAAGLMSWVDLGLELVAQFMNPAIMRQLGKIMIVDTGLREQRYYQSFTPRLDHGDQAVLKAQHHLQQHFQDVVKISTLSRLSILTERTFLRRFVKATGFKPIQYLQRLRIQKACNLIESTNETFESISFRVGYEDASAFRKTFQKIVGLTPRDFRHRFSAR